MYVTRRLRKDGSTYFGPYFPGNLAHRLVHFIHRHFKVPSCKVDLTRYHPQPVPAVPHPPLPGAVRRGADHRRCLRRRRARRAAVPGRPPQGPGRRTARAHGTGFRRTRFEEAAALRDLLSTVEEMEERQKMAAAKGDDVDIFRLLRRAAAGGREPVSPAQRPHRRPARVLLGRPARVRPPEFFSSLLKQTLSGPAVHSRPHPRAGGLRRSRAAGRTALRAARAQGGDPHAAARPEEGHARTGGDQREAQLRAALPRAEAVVEGDSGGAAGRAGSARKRRAASSASTSRTSRAPTKWPAWWCGKTGG